MSMYSGWQLVVLSRFDLEKACRVIQDFKLTFAYIPPPVVLALSKEAVVDKYDLTSLKVLHCGAAPITSDLIEMVWKRLKVPVKQGYGLSEASPVSHVQPPDEWAKFMTSVGKLVPNMESKIVDTEGNEVALGEVRLLRLSLSQIRVISMLIRAYDHYRQASSGSRGLTSSEDI